MLHIVREGYPFIGFCLALAIVLGLSVNIYVAVIPAVLAIYFMYFFRNPRREIAVDDNHILSPADGTVQEKGKEEM